MWDYSLPQEFFGVYSYQGVASCYFIFFHRVSSVLSMLRYFCYIILFYRISSVLFILHSYQEVIYIIHGIFIQLRTDLTVPIGSLGTKLSTLCLKKERKEKENTRKNNYKKKKKIQEKKNVKRKRKHKKKDEETSGYWNSA